MGLTEEMEKALRSREVIRHMEDVEKMVSQIVEQYNNKLLNLNKLSKSTDV